MSKIKLVLIIMFCSILTQLSSLADYSFSTVEPLQFSPYTNPFPNRIPNPYYLNSQQYRDRCQYPYGYRNYGINRGIYAPGYYGYGNNYIQNQIVRNASQNLLYSLIHH